MFQNNGWRILWFNDFIKQWPYERAATVELLENISLIF